MFLAIAKREAFTMAYDFDFDSFSNMPTFIETENVDNERRVHQNDR